MYFKNLGLSVDWNPATDSHGFALTITVMLECPVCRRWSHVVSVHCFDIAVPSTISTIVIQEEIRKPRMCEVCGVTSAFPSEDAKKLEAELRENITTQYLETEKQRVLDETPY